jgi:hypothetical protein
MSLKKLASEVVTNSLSEKAVEFIKQIPGQLEKMDNEKLKGRRGQGLQADRHCGIHTDGAKLENAKEVLLAEGYNQANTYVAYQITSVVRDGLSLMLTICD